ncbi:hypothetical protein [Methylicorpusculum sp.]|uniref:hypothetical protein n=1 Tax=Methylicorpusculum sp. TaxID=2713644 RepID=UPI002AB844C8|nr:hypothetical protein [Methylicorpusculum sp.]MDZ4151340.1 hypothetical protein [Methylicorpusculum sp.]
MIKKQLSFYATRDDLLKVLEAAASKTNFYYACVGQSDNGLPIVYEAANAIPNFSGALYGDLNRESFCLLIEPNVEPGVRVVEQSNGGVKYFFDQVSHPASVVLKPGGVLDDSECIISGQVGTISQDKWSEEIYKSVAASFRKQFTKIKSFYVGSEASEKLDLGFRLTTNIKSPTEYDLLR